MIHFFVVLIFAFSVSWLWAVWMDSQFSAQLDLTTSPSHTVSLLRALWLDCWLLRSLLMLCWFAERLKKRQKIEVKRKWKLKIVKSLKNGDNLLFKRSQKNQSDLCLSYSWGTRLSAISVIGTSFYRSDKVRNFQIVDILKCKTLINRSCKCFIRQSLVNHQTVFNQFWYLYPFHSLFCLVFAVTAISSF